MNRTALLFYVSEYSGHHRAALALQESLPAADRQMEAKTINTLQLTNPLLENIVLKTYLGIIKNAPDVWDYLYDNRTIKEKIENFQKFVHKVKASKLLKVVEANHTCVLVCTQAFPCGILADCKARGEIRVPLVAVITDFAAHAYWVYEAVDLYIVPTEDVRRQFISYGIPEEKILVLGVPISPQFNHKPDPAGIRKKYGLSKDLPLVLIMGGGHGLIPMEEIVEHLDSLDVPFDIFAITGTNRSLRADLQKKRGSLKKRMEVQGYLTDVAPIMSAADILISKPGGLTISEAMACTLPMILINPLPGQEARNTQFLLREGVSVMARDAAAAAGCVRKWLEDGRSLQDIRKKITQLRKPNAATQIAGEILKLVRVQSLAV